MYARKRQYLHVFESEIGEEQQRKLAKYRKNAKSSGKTRKINLKRQKQANQLAQKRLQTYKSRLQPIQKGLLSGYSTLLPFLHLTRD